MRRIVFCALLSLLAGQAAAQGATPDAPDFSADRFRAHVSFLADDRLEGRETGSRGYDIAAAYVASQFLSLGLTPGGEKGSWYQPIAFRSAVLNGTPSITLSGPKGTERWENATEVLLGPSLVEQVQDITAPVIFVGYGVDAPDQGMDDYRGLDVRGKIVAVLGGMPDGLPSEIAAHLGDSKRSMAARRGAIGLITIPTRKSSAVTSWQASLAYAGRPSISWLDKQGRPKEEAAGLRVSAALSDKAAAALFAGASKSYRAVREAADKSRARPRGFPLATQVRVQRNSTWSTIESAEVIGLLPGSDPLLKEEYVVLMGHLDHLGLKAGAKPGEDAVYNGAIDNASGIATMLEAARAFTQTQQRPRRSILFIANTAEEKGLLGADYFAHNPTVAIERIAAVVDLDMPMLLYDFQDVIAFGAEHSTLAHAVDEAAAEMGLKLSPDPMPEQNIFVRSDHYVFVRQGVPAVLLATGFANGGAAVWSDFLSRTYHGVGDDLSQKINWQAGARYARLNYLISRKLANSDTRPLWYRGDYFGNLFAPDKPRAPAAAK